MKVCMHGGHETIRGARMVDTKPSVYVKVSVRQVELRGRAWCGVVRVWCGEGMVY